jgi:hypothetical protein
MLLPDPHGLGRVSPDEPRRKNGVDAGLGITSTLACSSAINLEGRKHSGFVRGEDEFGPPVPC